MPRGPFKSRTGRPSHPGVPASQTVADRRVNVVRALKVASGPEMAELIMHPI